MTSLSKDTKEYFASKGTISKWWNVDKGHLSFHYNKELKVLDENEKLIKPYYTHPSFVRRCTHTVGWGVIKE